MAIEKLENSLELHATDEILATIETLKSQVNSSKQNDLMTYKQEIIEELEKEIASRYYFERGTIEASFDEDADVSKALEVLNSPEKYASILSGTN